MWSQTTGRRRSIAVGFLIRAVSVTVFVPFAVVWLVIELFVVSTIHSPCLPESSIPAGFEQVLIPTMDGFNLRGLWKPSQNGAVILFMGGVGSGRITLIQEARWLSEEGFGAVLVEGRSCPGGSHSLGYRESGDFLAMMNFARSREKVDWFGAFGFSSGAAAAVRAAAETPDIRAVVAEGGFANLAELLAPNGNDKPMVERVLQNITLAVFWKELKFWPGLVSPIDDLKNVAPRPILLIYGGKEPNRKLAEEMLDAGGDNARLWIVNGAGHGQYGAIDPDGYKQVLQKFFTEAKDGSVE